jgi:hypothetical protein
MSENLNQSSDYISLSSIKHILIALFRIFFKILDFLIDAIWKHVYVFLFCCLIGLLAGYIYYKQSAKYFKTEMIVQPTELTRKAYHEIIANLNDLLRFRSHTNFASQLQISPVLGRKVISIEATGINNQSLVPDTSTKNGQVFKIHVETVGNTSLAELQTAILNYLNTNPYVKLIKKGQQKIYLDKLQFIEQEQKKLDTLKSNYNLTMASIKMPATFYNNALNPSELYQHSLNLANEKEKILKWLNNESQAILLIDGLKSPANPQSKSLFNCLFIGLILGAFIGFVLSFLLKLKARIS